jgi:hypothetical protein
MRQANYRAWKVRLVFVAVAAVLTTTTVAGAAPEGTITALSATDAPDPGQTITISASFLASSRIVNSNVFYQVIAPDGVTVVGTRSLSLPSLSAGETFTDSWTMTNTSFPSSGTYTLVACWSPGGSPNCQIDRKTTSFFSVPILSGGLWLAAAGLFAWFLWRRRSDFRGRVRAR